jgi:hypothetical protein
MSSTTAESSKSASEAPAPIPTGSKPLHLQTLSDLFPGIKMPAKRPASFPKVSKVKKQRFEDPRWSGPLDRSSFGHLPKSPSPSRSQEKNTKENRHTVADSGRLTPTRHRQIRPIQDDFFDLNDPVSDWMGALEPDTQDGPEQRQRPFQDNFFDLNDPVSDWMGALRLDTQDGPDQRQRSRFDRAREFWDEFADLEILESDLLPSEPNSFFWSPGQQTRELRTVEPEDLAVQDPATRYLPYDVAEAIHRQAASIGSNGTNTQQPGHTGAVHNNRALQYEMERNYLIDNQSVRGVLRVRRERNRE